MKVLTVAFMLLFNYLDTLPKLDHKALYTKAVVWRGLQHMCPLDVEWQNDGDGLEVRHVRLLDEMPLTWD